ncbi:MAG: UDP-2,4-diacetamido-2,4,6-trideoxy-beta-L-altropyranose hydrolase, partial [Desulfobacteraceae bacterium]
MNTSLSAPLFIRADASSRIGTGHVMRCLALAQAWKKRGGRAIFIGIMPEIFEGRLAEEGFAFHALPAPHPDGRDLAITLKIIQNHPRPVSAENCWVVIDGYHLDAVFQNAMRKAGLRVLVVDDYGHQPEYAADILLNQNPGAEKIKYPDPKCRFLLGTKYALLRNELLDQPITVRFRQGPAKNILVSMGGADPENATLKILHALLQANFERAEIKVLVGPTNNHRDSLEQFRLQHSSNFSLIDHVQNMRPLLEWADMAVSAAGSTCFEFARFGIPMILVVLADNQRLVANSLAEKKAALNLGQIGDFNEVAAAEVLSKSIRDRGLLRNLSRNSREMVDGRGRSRVSEAMTPTDLRLRLAQETDCQLFLRWANEPYVRAMSFYSELISEQTHSEWFRAKLGNRNSRLWVAENADGIPVGQIRFDKKDRNAVVSLSLDPEFRGLGLGARLIRLGCRDMSRDPGISAFMALIKEENISSYQAFTKAGFKIADPSFHHGKNAVVMKY